MTQQSEALRLADRLDTYATGDAHQQDIEQAAVELRRLDAALQSPQRIWVGLTDAELTDMHAMLMVKLRGATKQRTCTRPLSNGSRRRTMDEIIRMAREAGFNPVKYMGSNLELFIRFAELVRAPLQERIQDLYRQLNEAERELDSQYKLGMEAEREQCAKVCEDDFGNGALNLAAAIRARGQA
jgi:hypothetical protein